MIRSSIIISMVLMALALPARGEYLSFTSQSPGSSEIDAIDQARRQAALELVPVLRQRVETELRKRGGGKLPSDEMLAKIISEQLASPGVFKTTPRKESRSYGTLYYADAKIDMAAEWLANSTLEAIDNALASRQRIFNSAGAIGALFAVVGFVYLAANALTRGYYQWRLRLAAAASSLVGIGAVVALYLGMA